MRGEPTGGEGHTCAPRNASCYPTWLNRRRGGPQAIRQGRRAHAARLHGRSASHICPRGLLRRGHLWGGGGVCRSATGGGIEGDALQMLERMEPRVELAPTCRTTPIGHMRMAGAAPSMHLTEYAERLPRGENAIALRACESGGNAILQKRRGRPCLRGVGRRPTTIGGKGPRYRRGGVDREADAPRRVLLVTPPKV